MIFYRSILDLPIHKEVKFILISLTQVRRRIQVMLHSGLAQRMEKRLSEQTASPMVPEPGGRVRIFQSTNPTPWISG